jgi:RNA polymerase sigma factor for flagellar operon FliA
MRQESLKTWSSRIRLSDHDLGSTWETYCRTGDRAAYEHLTEHYLPRVKYYCQWFHNRLPKEVDLDDVISGGMEGLRRAICAFDPSRGVKFETYSTACIRGAVLDALRKTDHLSCLMRRRATHLRRSREELTAELGRPPTDEELAACMGLADSEFSCLINGLIRLTRLGRRWPDECGGPGSFAADAVVDTHTESPVGRLQRETLKAMLTRGLTKQERTILILYYYEEMTMKEVGAVLGVSESRVCQMHNAIIERLRETMRGREEEFLPLRQPLPRQAWTTEC